MIDVLLRDLGNATADFYGTTETTESDPHGDAVTTTNPTTDPVHAAVTVRYQERATESQVMVGFDPTRYGDIDASSPLLIAPGDIADDVPEGARVVLTYRGEVLNRRITASDHLTIDESDEGLFVAEIDDYGD